jgi:hypothetical protein
VFINNNLSRLVLKLDVKNVDVNFVPGVWKSRWLCFSWVLKLAKRHEECAKAKKDYLISINVKTSDDCRQNSPNFLLSNPNTCQRDLFDEFMKEAWCGEFETPSWTNILIFSDITFKQLLD